MTHRLRLDNVDLSLDLPFTWSFRTGVTAGGGTFSVPLPRAAAVARLAGTGRTVSATYYDPLDSTGQRNESIRNVTLSGSYTVQPMGDALYAQFTLRDLRWTWAQRRVVGHFGLTRRTNDLDVVEAGDELDVPGQEVGPLLGGGAEVEAQVDDAGQIVGFARADVIGQTNPIPRTIYRPLTLDWSNEDFSGPAEQPKPWTAFRGIQALLRGYWVKRADGEFAFQPGVLADGEWGGLRGFEGREPDNGYPLARQSHMGTPLPQVLQQWMLLARVSCAVWVDGKLYLHPIDLTAEPDLPNRTHLQGGGRLVTRNMRVERPARVRVGFRVEQERLFGLKREVERTAPAEQADPSIALNVLKLPQPQTLDLGDGEREYPAGTYVPLGKVLDAWGISIDWVERHWFLQWQTYYPLVRGETPPGSTETQARVSAIRQSFRRLYQVSPYYVQQLLDISGDSVVLLDPVTGTRQPAPVWSDYTLTRNAKYSPLDLGDTELLWDTVRYARAEPDEAEDETDPAIPLPDTEDEDGQPGPFRVSIVDPTLGIVEVIPVNDLLGVIDQLHIGGIEAIEAGTEPVAIPSGNGAHLAGARLSADYGLAFVVTMLDLDPNTSDQLYWVDLAASDVNAPAGSAPVQEIVIQDETARVSYDGTVVNEKLLRARAIAEARSLYEAYNPVLIGSLTWGGWHQVYPIGTAAAVTWVLSNKRLSTTLEMPSPPVPRGPEQYLSQQYRDYVLRLPRSQ